MQSPFSLTLIFWEQVGDTYTFQLRWSNFNTTQLIYEWAKGRVTLPWPIPDDLINACTAVNYVPHTLNAGMVVQKLDKSDYTIPVDLKLSAVDLNTFTQPDFLTELSVQDFRQQYFISALCYYIPVEDTLPAVPAPSNGQMAVPPENNPTLPGIIHVSPYVQWGEYQCSITERNYYFGYTIARIRYLWFLDVEDVTPLHIYLNWEHIYDYTDPYLQADSIVKNYPYVSDYRGFDIYHFNDEYKDEYYAIEYRPPYPNRYWPPRNGSGGGDSGTPTDSPYWRDPSPIDLFDFPISSQGGSISEGSSGWEPLLFNGNPILFNGFRPGCKDYS